MRDQQFNLPSSHHKIGFRRTQLLLMIFFSLQTKHGMQQLHQDTQKHFVVAKLIGGTLSPIIGQKRVRTLIHFPKQLISVILPPFPQRDNHMIQRLAIIGQTILHRNRNCIIHFSNN